MIVIVYIVFLIMLFGGFFLIMSGNRRLLKRRKGSFLKAMMQADKIKENTICKSKIIRKRKELLLKKEIYKLTVFLENMDHIYKREPKGGNYIIEELSECSESLGDGLRKMVERLNVNRKEEAMEAFLTIGKTRDAQEFGKLLLNLDKINPAELEMSLTTLKDRLREELITAKSERNEIMSDVLYMPAIFNVMIILINFIYIAYFADQREFFNYLL